MAEGGRKVVIGVDESSFAEEAFNFYAANFLKENDVIILVHTPERYNFVDANLGTPVDRPAVIQELLQEIKKKTHVLEETYKKKLEASNIKSAKFVIKEGDAGEAIVAAAEKEGATLIITGTRGMGKLRRTFLGSVSPHVHRELLEEIKQKVESLEDKYTKKMEECGVQHGKFVKKHGNPGEAIIAVAEKEKANLIVTGCRGMGLIRRTFLGSVSDYVMHHAHCPVLVCRK